MNLTSDKKKTEIHAKSRQTSQANLLKHAFLSEQLFENRGDLRMGRDLCQILLCIRVHGKIDIEVLAPREANEEIQVGDGEALSNHVILAFDKYVVDILDLLVQGGDELLTFLWSHSRIKQRTVSTVQLGCHIAQCYKQQVALRSAIGRGKLAAGILQSGK